MEQQLQTLHEPDTLLQKRYLVEDLLGLGGFGAVYLARDQQNGEQFVALKELRDQKGNERQRLFLECEILMRLEHPSLPQVSGIFEQDNRLYMVMEYIAGPNLEILRKEQPERRFSVAEVIALLQSIVEAVTYLHQQHPPLIHRDIKPANIIVPVNGSRAVLVDFGIAKEYYADATTTAIRHCSPGYSSPEQYSSVGTDPRADVYGLGATCYTLLSGTLPVDALQRMTKLASKGSDPLLSLAELVEDVPLAVAAVIQQAMDINYERRFATPELFWQALTSQGTVLSEKAQGTAGQVSAIQVRVRPVRRTRGSQTLRSWRIRLALIFLLTGLISGLVCAFQLHSAASHSAHTSLSVITHLAPTKSALKNYPLLRVTYTGTLDNLLNNTTTEITFTTMQQNTQAITGIFTVLQPHHSRPLSGVIDTTRHLLLTVASQPGMNALFFDGTMRADGSLVGNYCSVDTSGQCAGGEYGLWDVLPSAVPGVLLPK